MEGYIYDEFCKREKNDWWFVGRRKIISTLLPLYLKKKKGLSIIDIGCGAGDVMMLLAKFGQVKGVDNNRQIVSFNKREGRDVLLGDINKLNLPPSTFDLVTLLEVLEHLDDDTKALEKAFALLRPKGTLLITVPAFSFLWGPHDDAAHHKRRYTKRELEKKLLKTGFKVIKTSYMNTFLFPAVFTFRLIRNVFKVGGKRSDFLAYPPLINGLLQHIFSGEAECLKKVNFPVGVSLLVIAQKP